MSTRTQEEIAERVWMVMYRDDWCRTEHVLMPHLDWAHARQFFTDQVTADQWAEVMSKVLPPEEQARRYLEMAVSHLRWDAESGRLPTRSVDVLWLRELAWLLGRDDAVDAMDAADFAPGGEPKVRAFAESLGWPMATATEAGGPRG